MDDRLPPLVSIRGWNADDDPRYPAFIDQMRAADIDVFDIYIEADTFSTIGEWAAAAIAEIDEAITRGTIPNQPLHLIGYCLGGNILTDITNLLTQQHRPPAYVGLIDVFLRTPAMFISYGLYGRFAMPWRRIPFLQMSRFSAPENETLHAVIGSWARQLLRATRTALRRGPIRSRRENIRNWHAQRLAYNAKRVRITVLLHLYVSSFTLADNNNDPSCGMARYLCGGFNVSMMPGVDHHTCIEPPFATELIATINRDRNRVA